MTIAQRNEISIRDMYTVKKFKKQDYLIPLSICCLCIYKKVKIPDKS